VRVHFHLLVLDGDGGDVVDDASEHGGHRFEEAAAVA